jgi:hypothetical protein
VAEEDSYEERWFKNPDRTRRDLSFISKSRSAVLRDEAACARR